MNLTRSLLSLSLVCGACFAADQRQDNLPTAMSSAIDRVVNNEADLPKPHFLPSDPKLKILQFPPAAVRFGLNQCSIPLAEAKVRDKSKFFIRQLPVPKDSPDSMPVLKAPVCPTAQAK